MATSPLPSELRIDSLKITGYPLNVNSPRGAAKARYLSSYGYDVSRPNELAASLFEHFRRCKKELRSESAYGARFICRGPMTGCPNGKSTAEVVSVWEAVPVATYLRLITAYPA